MPIDTTFLTSKLARRIFLLFVVCALVPVAVLAVLSFFQVRSQLADQSRQRIREYNRNIALEIVERLLFLEDELAMVGALFDAAPSSARDALLGMDVGLAGTRYSGVWVTDDSRAATTLFGEAGGEPTLDPEQRRHLDDGRSVLLLSPEGWTPGSLVMGRRFGGETTPSRIWASVDPLYIWTAGSPDNLPRGTVLFVLSGDGELLFASGYDAAPADGVRLPLASSASGEVEWEVSGERFVASYWSMTLQERFASELTVVLAEPASYSHAPMATFGRLFPLVVLLAFGTVLLLSIDQIRRTLGPLEALRGAAQRIARRDFRGTVAVTTDDEFGEVARSFDTMANELNRHFESMEAIAEIQAAVLSSLDVNDILVPILERTPELLKCSSVCVTLVKPGSEAKVFGRVRAGHLTAREEVAIEDTEWEELEAAGDRMLLREDDSRRTYLEPIRRYGHYDFLVVPIRLDERVVAIVAWAGESVTELSEDDLSLARHLADQLGVALANAWSVEHQLDLEAQLRQSQKLEAVGLLAGGVAHDFNNVLTGISGHAHLAAEKAAGDLDLLSHLDTVVDCVDRASRLTRQLLAFSRAQPMETSVVDVGRLVDSTWNMMSRLIPENIDLQMSADAPLPRIEADRGHLEQVLLNLVINAVDAMPDGGVLVVRAYGETIDEELAARAGNGQGDEYVVIGVADTGCGMSADIRERIFDPFFTTKPVGQGTGLGLSTAHGIVEQHGGFIEVESAPDVGTTVSVYLPATEAAAENTDRDTEPAVLDGTETVLVVEDEDLVRAVVQRTLRAYGYDVLVASDPGAAEKIFEESNGDIALLLTDVIMPGGNGINLYRQLSRAQPELKVLFISGYSGSAGQALAAFGDDRSMLRKPFSPERLARVVRQVLDAS